MGAIKALAQERENCDVEECELFWAEVLYADPAYLDWLESLGDINEIREG